MLVAALFLALLLRNILSWLDSFDWWKWRQFGKFGFVFYDFIQEILQILLAERSLESTVNLFGFKESDNRGVSDARDSKFILEVELVTTLRPEEFERFAFESQPDFFDSVEVILSLLYS